MLPATMEWRNNTMHTARTDFGFGGDSEWFWRDVASGLGGKVGWEGGSRDYTNRERSLSDALTFVALSSGLPRRCAYAGYSSGSVGFAAGCG
ncbi:unnamed protein product [Gongylonema pulchrum]|uniref:Esterase n=1 Tax=Gongylonema pulchrum TaxID=637853 RepID=A0A183DPC5_9BILA|nr:unnamed protein product [Gongylonema pulchrum]